MNTSAPTLPGALSSVAVAISHAWGVRSIGAFGNGLTADVVGPASNELDDGNSNVIPLSSVGTNDTSPPPGLTLATGDIIFTMDLSGLGVSGTYSGDFTITVTSP